MPPTVSDPDPASLLGSSLRGALEEIGLPCYLLDAAGRLRWQNAAARAVIGDRLGEHYADLLPRDYRAAAKRQFARNVLSGRPADFDARVVDTTGSSVYYHVRSVPVRSGDEIVGAFGIGVAHGGPAQPREEADDTLTPRQLETLRLLGQGLQTKEIASQLGVAEETARNHVRALLRGLGVHSRLEAVAVGRRRGLLDD